MLLAMKLFAPLGQVSGFLEYSDVMSPKRQPPLPENDELWVITEWRNN